LFEGRKSISRRICNSASTSFSKAPSAIEERASARRGYIWVGGHHEWRRHRYVWRRGHYVHERRGYEYAPGRWERHENHYDWHDGAWHPHR
jgi:hypothetical protein